MSQKHFPGSKRNARTNKQLRNATGARPGGSGMIESLETRVLLSTYYVSTGGSDSAAGGTAAPFRTLQKAANIVRSGDTVIVRPGTYAGFYLETSGTASAPITFKAEPGVVLNQPNSVTSDIVNLEYASYVTIDGFTVRDSPRNGLRATNTQGVVYRNNVVERSAMIGLYTSHSHDTLIENNVTRGSVGSHGVYIANSGDRPTIRNNVVSGNYGNGIHLNGESGDGIVSGALIEGNEIFDNGPRGGSAINGDGLNSSVIRNNLLYNNHASGISLYRIDADAGSRNNLVVNNTISMASDAKWALNINSGSTGNRVFNNILLNANPSTGAITISADSRTGFVSNYNAVTDRFSNGGSSSSLSSWRSATGQDANSLVASAGQLFANAGAGNYDLSASSPAKDRGVASLGGSSAPAKDMDGRARPSGGAYDIGAYELQTTPTTPTTPPTPPADTTAPTVSSVATSGVTSTGATVGWTTNEAATTQVEYGTTTAYGSRTTLDSALTTGHSAAITGLAADTTYYYRVLSRDAAGNLTTSAGYTFRTAPTTPTPPTNPTPPSPGTPWQQTTAADFGGGSTSGAVVTNTAGGELQLAPSLRDEFNDTALDDQWTATTWDAAAGGSSVLNERVLRIAGQVVSSKVTFGTVPVEARLAFGAASNQEFGLATGLQDPSASWAIFSTKSSTNTLHARVKNDVTSEGVNLGTLPAGFHEYRIQPVSGGFEFYVDDVLKTQINVSFASGTAARVMMSAVNPSPAPVLRVDWVGVPTTGGTGTFTSAVYDAGASVDWTTAAWNASVPAGTSVLVETSTGNAATPDSTWSTWTSVGADGAIASPNGRFVRYRVTFVSADGATTPTLYDITLNRA